MSPVRVRPSPLHFKPFFPKHPSSAAVVAVALAVYVFCCFLSSADLLGAHSADVGYYGQLARSMRDGAIPYRDLYVEYPPGALPVFAAPAVSLHHYGDIFSVLMAICGALALLVLASAARALDMSDIELGRALAPVAVAPFLLGGVFLNRYDPWPMLLSALALAALIRGRLGIGSGTLALAVVAKVYALASVPVTVLYVVRCRGGPGLRRAALVFAGVGAVLLVPFVLLGPGGVAFSLYEQVTRNVEVESLSASALLVAGRLGLYHAHTIVGSLNSNDLVGAVPTVAGILTSCIALGSILAAAVWYWRGQATRERFVLAFAVALVGYVTFGKVLSTQYMVWLLPIVPLVRGWVGHAATALLAVATWLTKLEYAHLDALARGTGLTLLVARNLTLVGLYVWLAVALRGRVRRAAVD
ncbi:MAG: glycosyltransferase 87 family protein [Actinomycetota bacterium]|nr:glycosyltransferase 87 family protein [Actinomycetota bacterium]